MRLARVIVLASASLSVVLLAAGLIPIGQALDIAIPVLLLAIVIFVLRAPTLPKPPRSARTVGRSKPVV